MKRSLIALAAAAALSTPVLMSPAFAAEAGGSTAAQMATQQKVFGAEIMSKKEIEAYEKELAAAKTPADRAKLETQHHDKMVALAKKKGVTLSEPAAAPAPGADRDQGNY